MVSKTSFSGLLIVSANSTIYVQNQVMSCSTHSFVYICTLHMVAATGHSVYGPVKKGVEKYW